MMRLLATCTALALSACSLAPASSVSDGDGAATPTPPAAADDGAVVHPTSDGAVVSIGDAATTSDPPDAGGVPIATPSGLPVPPGAANVAQPSASGAANIQVLHWAGFSGAVTFSLDDSQPSQIDHFDDLAATGVPFTWYITVGNDWYAGFVGAWEKAVKRGDELANHTVHHCDFNQICNTSQPLTPEHELDDCTTYIGTTLGGPTVYTFAYPFGDMGYEPDAKTRFLIARSSAPGFTKPGTATDPFAVPTTVIDANEPPATMNGLIDQAKSGTQWLTFTIHSVLPDSANWYNGTDVSSIVSSIDHAKGIDVWIDTMQRIGAYWRGENAANAAFAGKTAPTTATTWTWTVPAHFPPGQFLRVTVAGGTLTQNGKPLVWDPHGYYEVSLDAPLSWAP